MFVDFRERERERERENQGERETWIGFFLCAPQLEIEPTM